MRSIEELYDDIEAFNLFFLFVNSEPLDFDESFKEKRWRQFMKEEIKGIEKNNTWELSTLSHDYQASGVKSMFKAKKNAKGDVKRYEASLFANGYKIKYGINYEELFVKKINIQ